MQTLSIVSKNLAKGIQEYIYKDDIVSWVRDIQEKEPDDFQIQFLEAQDMEIMLLWGRQTGKTEMAAFQATHKARYEPGSVILVVSSTQRQAGILQRVANFAMMRATGIIKHSGWQKIKDDMYMWEFDPYDPIEEQGKIVKRSILSLELMSGSQIISVPATPDTVRGYSPNLIIVDEAAWVQTAVYDAILPMRAAKPVQLISISSANMTSGFFYTEWQHKDPDILKIRVTADDCERIKEEWLERERKRPGMTEDIFLREYYCKFMPPEGSIFTDEMINSIFRLSPDDKRVKSIRDDEQNVYISPEGWK